MLRAALLAVLGCAALPAWAVPSACIGPLSNAFYTAETDRYPHGALGDPYEYAKLGYSIRLTLPCRAGASGGQVVLPDELVFEDVRHPVMADLDGDGVPEIITVESHQAKGARVAIYGQRGDGLARIATTPFIGTRFRWLAVIGAADFDGDGKVEIAYIDRPHLAKTLRVWRFDKGALHPVADLAGLTNHRFGEPEIQGGIRHCDGKAPEIVTANSSWTRVIATRLTADGLHPRDLGPYTGPKSLQRALSCKRP